jgi:hypothetical protein
VSSTLLVWARPVPNNIKEAEALIGHQFLELNLSSRANDADALRIFALASHHGLVVFDPDGPALYPPDASSSTIT